MQLLFSAAENMPSFSHVSMAFQKKTLNKQTVCFSILKHFNLATNENANHALVGM